MNICLSAFDTKEQAQFALQRLNKINDLARAEMRKFSAISNWEFGFDRAKRRMGRCSYRRRLITLSAPLALLNSDEEILDTIKHEIAHALVGPRAGHGRMWKVMAINVGAKPERCYGSAVVKPPANWIGECESCGVRINRFRLTRRNKNSHHVSCGLKGLPAKITWSRNVQNGGSTMKQ